MLQLFSLLESEAAKTAYTSWLAEALGLSSDGLYAELVRTARKEAERKERYARYEQERGEKRTPEPIEQAPETQAQKRYKKALFEILEVLLEYEEIAGIACEQVPPELLDQTPAAVAVNEVIQAKMLDEWSDAAAHIIEKLEPQGLISQELSLLLIGKEEEPEPPIPEGLTEDQITKIKKERQRAFNRKKKLALKVFEEDLQLLKEYSLSVRLERLMERFSRLAPDDPEKLNLMTEITMLTRERAALRK